MPVKGQIRKRVLAGGRQRQRRAGAAVHVGASKIEARRILDELHEMPAPRGYAALGDILGGYLGSAGRASTTHLRRAGSHPVAYLTAWACGCTVQVSETARP